MPKNPWSWLYERETQPLKSYVLDEVSKRLADYVESWPPKLDGWEDEPTRIRFEPLLTQVRGRPIDGVVRLAIQLLRWDIEREYEETDRYMRGEHWREHVEPGQELETALFLWRLWMDQTMAFKEYAQEKFTRADLLGIPDRLQTRLLDAPPTPPIPPGMLQ